VLSIRPLLGKVQRHQRLATEGQRLEVIHPSLNRRQRLNVARFLGSPRNRHRGLHRRIVNLRQSLGQTPSHLLNRVGRRPLVMCLRQYRLITLRFRRKVPNRHRGLHRLLHNRTVHVCPGNVPDPRQLPFPPPRLVRPPATRPTLRKDEQPRLHRLSLLERPSVLAREPAASAI
jgi:hypothetical protein